MKNRILFVDDEPLVLDGLKRLLRTMRKEWDMVFVSNAAEALEILKKDNIDVLVTDYRMPGMDGAELLMEAVKIQPQVVRIILSGASDMDSIIKSVRVTHRFLAKPCNGEELKDCVKSACSLRSLLNQEVLTETVSRIESLPSLPSLYKEMMDVLRSPDATVNDVGAIIKKDMGMTAKILQLVNSAFFGMRTKISDPTQAASYLGLDMIRTLVLSIQIFTKFQHSQVSQNFINRLWSHSLATAVYASEIAKFENMEKRDVDYAFLSGLLHDSGKLILASRLPLEYGFILRKSNEDQICHYDMEIKHLGISHAELGAYLMGLWGLPSPIVETIAFHHTPKLSGMKRFSVMLAVHVGTSFDHKLKDEQCDGLGQMLDYEYLEETRFISHVPKWEALIKSISPKEISVSLKL